MASRSPRRSDLLAQIGVPFVVIAADIDETPLPEESPHRYVSRVTLDKARAARLQLPRTDSRPILAADTEVIVDERVLGKPQDEDDAIGMMRLLSGRTHQVLTAVALLTPQHEWLAHSVSRVTFRIVGDEEARRYWRTGEPADKAGGYAIQGYGALFIAHLQGSYSGVMGLPLFETGRLLEQAGILPRFTDDSAPLTPTEIPML